jgi:hypothetical protein
MVPSRPLAARSSGPTRARAGADVGDALRTEAYRTLARSGRECCVSIKGEATAPAVGELYAVLFRGWGSPAFGQSCGRFVLRGGDT